MTFDWGMVAGFIGSPLPTPAFAFLNLASGLFLMTFGIIGLAYAGPEKYKYLPLFANGNFD